MIATRERWRNLNVKIYKELDAPEAQNVAATLIFGFLIFFSGTFLMTLLGIGLEKESVFTWFEIGFHLLCLVAVVPLMREYLSFSWLTVGVKKQAMVKGCVLTGAIILLYALVVQHISLEDSFDENNWYKYCTMPVWTNNLYLTNSGIVSLSPVFGTACAVLIAPLVTCCLYYATAFAKGYSIRPWLGYLLLAVVTMFPRIATGVFGWWNTMQQFMLFAVQFPVHLCCCVLYAKTDNIWAPVFTQMGVNLVSCLMIILTKAYL